MCSATPTCAQSSSRGSDKSWQGAASGRSSARSVLTHLSCLPAHTMPLECCVENDDVQMPAHSSPPQTTLRQPPASLHAIPPWMVRYSDRGTAILMCRFVMGSTKMLRVALGKSEADELRTNLSQLSARLKGQVGLFFTKLSREEVDAKFEEFEVEDFARAGSKATHNFTLQVCVYVRV